MIAHYRVLNIDQEEEQLKLRQELQRSNEENTWRLDGDIYNRYRNSTRNSFHDLSPESTSDKYRMKSFHRKRRVSNSPAHKNEKSFLLSDDSFPEDSMREIDSMKSDKRVTVHKEGIHGQVERLKKSLIMDYDNNSFTSDRVRKIQNQASKALEQQNDKIAKVGYEMKFIKEFFEGTSISNTSEYSRLLSPRVELKTKVNLSKREISEQEKSIRSLKDCLVKVDGTLPRIETVEEMKLSEWKITNQLELLKEELKEERIERMKVMKEYTDAQQRVSECEKERSELLYALSDMKAEVNEYRFLYDKTCQSIPELKLLLEQSAEQKYQFSNQVVNLKREIIEHKEAILDLENKIIRYETLLNTTKSENMRLANEVADYRSMHDKDKKELESTKKMLINARVSYEELEQSRQQLQEKALSILKLYRSRCQKYEKKILDYNAEQKEKARELAKAVSQSKKLEIVNFKQKKDFKELALRIEGLQEDISEYVFKCDKLSEEKSYLERILSESNIHNIENTLLQKKICEIEKNNVALNNKLQNENAKRVEIESLCRQHADTILTLEKKLNYNKIKLEKEIIAVKPKSKNESLIEIKDLVGSNEKLSEKAQFSNNIEKEIRERYEELQSKLEVLIKQNTGENVKKDALNEILDGIYTENKKIRELFFKAITYSASYEKKRNELLQKQCDDIENFKLTQNENFKSVINILEYDVDNLLISLSTEGENIRPDIEISEQNIIGYKDEVANLRGKLHSSFSMAILLKDRFNKQNSLINRAREKIKWQILEIEGLTNSKFELDIQYQEKIRTLHKMQLNQRELMSMRESENNTLKKQVTELAKDLQESTKALHKCIELDKNRNAVLHEIDKLRIDQKMWMDINEDFVRSEERDDVLNEKFYDAKKILNDIMEDETTKSDIANLLIQTIESVSPSRKRRLSSKNSQVLESKRYILQNKSPSQSFTADFEISHTRHIPTN